MKTLSETMTLHDMPRDRHSRSGGDRTWRARKVLGVNLALLVAMLVMAFSAAASAQPAPARVPGTYTPAYRSIASDDRFQSNYWRWRRQYPRFDWSTDNCSGPSGLTGYADDFRWPCVQHDFAYRNNRLVNMHNEGTRGFADGQLREHTRNICSRRSGLDQFNCYRASNTFYSAVRAFGGGSW